MLWGVCTLRCVLWYAVVCCMMSCVWVHMYLLPFQGTGGGGGGAGKQLLFLF